MKGFKIKGGKIILSESAISAQVQTFLNLKKLFWWRVNTGVASYESEKTNIVRHVAFGTPGESDIAILAHKYCVIELKNTEEHKKIIKNYDKYRNHVCDKPLDKRKKCSLCHYQRQIQWIEKVQEKGHYGFFASSLDQVEEKLIEYGII